MFPPKDPKALAQYQRSEEVPYTFAYTGFKEAYYPRGTVAVTIKNGIWVTKVPACLETSTLVNRLVRYIVKENLKPGGKRLTNTVENDVRYALRQMTMACDFVIHAIELKNKNDVSDHTLTKPLKPMGVNEPSKVIKSVVRYLRNYAFKEEIRFKEGVLSLETDIIEMVISSKILAVKREEASVLMLNIADRSYLTNIIATPDNVSKVIEFLGVFERIRRLNVGITNPRLIECSIINTVFYHCHTRVSLRPAYICKNADGGHRLIHRPIIPTERRVTIDEPLVLEAARILLSINDVIAR